MRSRSKFNEKVEWPAVLYVLTRSRQARAKEFERVQPARYRLKQRLLFVRANRLANLFWISTRGLSLISQLAELLVLLAKLTNRVIGCSAGLP